MIITFSFQFYFLCKKMIFLINVIYFINKTTVEIQRTYLLIYTKKIK